jgi:hypothetical protein
MTSEQRPQDQQCGFETSGELHRAGDRSVAASEFPPFEAQEAPSPAAASRGRLVLGIVLAVVAVVIVGLVIYFLVT